MKRKTKRFPALLLAAAMAFGLCTSAFAETATPETTQSTAEAVEPQTVDGLDDATDDQVDSAATVYVVRQAEGMVLTLFEQSYENFQEALNAVETAQVDTSYDGDEDVYYLASIVLDKNITGAFTVPAYTGNTGSLPTLYFNGHFITAENGPALTMDKGSKLYISDDDYTGYIYGGNYPAIRIADTSESSIWIHGGAYMADSQLPISMDSDLQGLVQVQEGKFSHELPAYMICPNTADTIYRQHFDGGLYTVKGYPPVNGNAVAQDDDGNAYTTLQEAINVSKSDITLLADITESVEIGVYANVTIDFNGHTMTASDEYYAINSDGQLKLLDSSADQKGGTRSEILNKGMMQVYSGTYSVTTGNVFDNSGTATLWGGKYYGAPNQAVFLCYEGSGNPNMMSTGITFVDIEAYAGEGGTILGRQPGSTCFYVFAQQGSLGGGYFYGDLGMSEPEMVQLFGGHFDREPSADCVYTADNKAREIIKEGKFWRVTEKVNDPVATVTGEDGTNIPFASLNDAVNRAAKLEAEKNDYYTVTLNKDVTTNVLTSFVTNKTVTIDLNGHILTAQDANKAAISAAGTKIFLRGSEGTINGRIESDTYLWIIHTTVNALNGQPAIVNTSADNNQLSVKGTSVINGTAGQAVIVSNGCTVIGDESVLKAGENGVLFQKGENAKDGTCFDLDFCTLYGDLGDAAARAAINIRVGKQCYVRFDRVPNADCLPAGMVPVLKDGVYWLEPAAAEEPDSNVTVDNKEQGVASTVDTSKVEVPTVEEKIPTDKIPTQAEAQTKAEKLKNELMGDNAAVKSFRDNDLNNAVKLNELDGVTEDSVVELSIQVELQDIKLGVSVEKDAAGNVTEVKLGSRTLVFDVTPMVKVDNRAAAVLGNDKLNGSNVVFRLPIPAEVTEMYAVVTHAGDPDRYYTIQTGEDGKKYIEVSTTHFSVFTVNFTNTLPAFDDTAEETTPAQTAPTQTAPKQDDSAYYTCKACGYHDWTAIDGGYKCDHCGYVESVKQIAGYPNVKGKAEVGKTAAVKAQAAAKTMSAIPQTSDDMPVTALAVIALAALLGLGVTVVMKRKHE